MNTRVNIFVVVTLSCTAFTELLQLAVGYLYLCRFARYGINSFAMVFESAFAFLSPLSRLSLLSLETSFEREFIVNGTLLRCLPLAES